MDSHQRFQDQLNRTMELQRQSMENQMLRREIEKNNPNISLQQLVSETQNQNRILSEQVSLLRQENDLQKQRIEEAREAAKEAKKDAKNAKVFSWISFAVSTLIAVASLIVAIVK